MRRNAMQQLYDWKEKSTRKPLIIRGARQVGKTWLMKEFAATAYKQFAYINFEDNEVMKEVFQKDFDIERILMAIQLVTGRTSGSPTRLDSHEIFPGESATVSCYCSWFFTGHRYASK